MKYLSLLITSIILFSFQLKDNKPKTVSVTFTIQEAIDIINAVKSSESISAKQASIIENKINSAYQLALADSTKQDSTHKK